MKPALVSLRVAILVVVDAVVTREPVGVVRPPKAVVITVAKAAATLAAAHAPPTRGSHGKTQVTALAMVPRLAASAARKRHAHRVTASHACRAMKSNARTRAAPALTWASSATTSMNANPPAMCLQAFPHRDCPHAAVAVVAGAVTGVEAVAIAAEAATGAAAVRVQAVAAGVGRAADFSADRIAG